MRVSYRELLSAQKDKREFEGIQTRRLERIKRVPYGLYTVHYRQQRIYEKELKTHQ